MPALLLWQHILCVSNLEKEILVFGGSKSNVYRIRGQLWKLSLGQSLGCKLFVIAFRPDSKNRIGAQHHAIEMHTNIQELCRQLRKKQVLRSTVLGYNSTIIHKMYRNSKNWCFRGSHFEIFVRISIPRCVAAKYDVTWLERYSTAYCIIQLSFRQRINFSVYYVIQISRFRQCKFNVTLRCFLLCKLQIGLISQCHLTTFFIYFFSFRLICSNRRQLLAKA